MQSISEEGEKLIRDWLSATSAVAKLKEQLLKAERELQSAEEHLAIWLIPSDAEPGEKFCIWYGDSLLSARSPTDDEYYEVGIRKRGRSLSI